MKKYEMVGYWKVRDIKMSKGKLRWRKRTVSIDRCAKMNSKNTMTGIDKQNRNKQKQTKT